MSTSYYIYTEAKIGDKWISIDPNIPKLIDKRKDYKEPHRYDGDYELKHTETYWNGSRSYFGQTFDRLEYLGRSIKFGEMSAEVKQHWKESVKDEETEEGDKYQSYFQYEKPIQVDYDVFKNSFNPDEYELHGLVHKDIWFSYQSGDIEDIYGVEHDDFKRLTKEERQCYEYHEWDDSMGWNSHFKELLKKVSQRIADFEDINGYWGDSNLKYRLIIIRC